MIHWKRLLPAAAVTLTFGCAGSGQLTDSPGSSLPGTASGPVSTSGPAVYAGNAESDPLSTAENAGAGSVSDISETDLFLDRISVGGDSLEAWVEDLPDLSDSLAAATQARLPSGEELFDYPVVINRRVLTWIDAFQGRARKSFTNSLRRSGRYVPMARRIFAEEGIPQDLVFLAHVESGFRHNARSRASAYGLWQFIRGTGRLYDLRCDTWVDERFDPEKSTRAAARHLRDLYARYNDWYLALAAYNAGAGKVDRAIQRCGTNDYWKIATTRHLRAETRNYVPAILAATILAKSPAAYGFPTETDEPLRYETTTVDSPTDLRVVARAARLDPGFLRDLNPALLYGQTPPGGPYEIRVPVGTAELASAELAKIPEEERLVFHRHTVRKGDTLGALARRYKTSVAAIQQANGMGRSTLIREGKTLKIPNRSWDAASLAAFEQGGSGGSGAAAVSADGLQDAAPDLTLLDGGIGQESAEELVAVSMGRVESTAHLVDQARAELANGEKEQEASVDEPPQGTPRVHTVRRGETLSSISRRYGVSVAELQRWNGLGRKSLIRSGEELVVSRNAARIDESADPRTLHHVSRGDTLWGIARKYGVGVNDLAAWNDLGRGGKIFPGQKLKIY